MFQRFVRFASRTVFPGEDRQRPGRRWTCLAAFCLALPASAGPRELYVRPQDGNGGDGSSYAQAWRGLATVDWTRIRPGDTLWVCGTFQGATERLLLPPGPAGVDGTARLPIVIDGGCRDPRGREVPGRIVAPEAPPAYGIETRRRDHFTFRNLHLSGYSILVLDSQGTLFENVEVRDAPRTANVFGAIDDRGLATVYDGVRIYNAGGNGISQGGRGHVAFWTPPPGSILWPAANSFLTKKDFQELPARTVLRNSLISRVGRRQDYIGDHAVDLYWNHEVLIENTTIVDPGGSGIRVHTTDRFPLYEVRTASHSGCPASCASHPGFRCVEPAGGGEAVCIDPSRDSLPALPGFDGRDPFVRGAPGLEPSIVIRGNTLRAHFQDGPRPQCIYGATGRACGSSAPCPFGYTCDAGACALAGGDCGNQHYGIVVPPGAPFVGTMLVEDNVIQGFAGNGILVETPYEAARGSFPRPTVTIRGNEISGSGHWGVWIGHHQPRYPTGQVLIEDNRIHDNGTPYQTWAHGGIQINAAAANVTVRNNFIHDNGEPTLDFPYETKHGGLVLASAPNGFTPQRIEVLNNTFVDNHTASLMTLYASPATVTSFARNLTVRGNLSYYSAGYAYDTRHTGVHAAWRLAPPGTSPPAVPEWSRLGPNLYFAEGFPPVVVDPRTFSVEDRPFSAFSTYQGAVQPFESGSVALDPDLDAALIPQNPAAAAFGAR